MHTLIIYEIFTFFHSGLFPKGGWVVYERLESFLELSNFGNPLATIMGDFITILFSPGFGLFYFSPVVFLSIYIFGKLITS
jgi:hypothetical protein